MAVRPFGMAKLVPAHDQTPADQGVHYDADRQIALTADGSPWTSTAVSAKRSNPTGGSGDGGCRLY